MTHHLGLWTLPKSWDRILSIERRHRATHHLILISERLLLILHLHPLIDLRDLRQLYLLLHLLVLLLLLHRINIFYNRLLYLVRIRRLLLLHSIS